MSIKSVVLIYQLLLYCAHRRNKEYEVMKRQKGLWKEGEPTQPLVFDGAPPSDMKLISVSMDDKLLSPGIDYKVHSS